MSATLVSQETARWTLYCLVPASPEHRGLAVVPPPGIGDLLSAAAVLEDRARVRLELAFPELVAAADLTKSEHGTEVLRAIAKYGVPRPGVQA